MDVSVKRAAVSVQSRRTEICHMVHRRRRRIPLRPHPSLVLSRLPPLLSLRVLLFLSCTLRPPLSTPLLLCTFRDLPCPCFLTLSCPAGTLPFPAMTLLCSPPANPLPSSEKKSPRDERSESQVVQNIYKGIVVYRTRTQCAKNAFNINDSLFYFCDYNLLILCLNTRRTALG